MAKKEATISVVEAAKRLETTERTITRYIKAGKLKATTELNERNQKRYLVLEPSIVAFLANKDNADRLIEAGVEGLSGSKTGGSEPVEPDNNADINKDKPDTLTVVGLLTDRIGELKNEVKDWQEKYEKRESDVHTYAFKLGKAEERILTLEAKTGEGSVTNPNSDLSDIPKNPEKNNKTGIQTLSVFIVGIFLVILIGGIMISWPFLQNLIP
jgi:hypothetical protein